jgi:hypothetical protein
LNLSTAAISGHGLDRIISAHLRNEELLLGDSIESLEVLEVPDTIGLDVNDDAGGKSGITGGGNIGEATGYTREKTYQC